MRVILIGFMGVGKTTIGKKIAHKLNYRHIDLDTFIEKEQNSTISKIFSELGENKFRELEHFWLKEILNINNVIISTGGGTPCYLNNINLLLESGITIYLKSDPRIIFERLRLDNVDRPLLKNKSETELKKYISKYLILRSPFYSKAKYTIEIENSSATEIADKINQLLQ